MEIDPYSTSIQIHDSSTLAFEQRERLVDRRDLSRSDDSRDEKKSQKISFEHIDDRCREERKVL